MVRTVGIALGSIGMSGLGIAIAAEGNIFAASFLVLLGISDAVRLGARLERRAGQ